MPNYRRVYQPGGIFFLTLVSHERRPIFARNGAPQLLGTCLRECAAGWPFRLDAVVLLPDHLHLLMRLPHGDSNYSNRIGWIKREFTMRWHGPQSSETLSPSRRRERRRSIWQPRFWEHTIRDENDLETHFDYIHFNPVKHGHAQCPADWPHSSFHRYVRSGHYAKDWGCTHKPPPNFDLIQHTVGE